MDDRCLKHLIRGLPTDITPARRSLACRHTMLADPSNPRSVALAFMRGWGGGIASLRSSITDYFTGETVWENVGLNRLVGQQDALAFIDGFHDNQGLDAITFDLVAILSDDRFVMTERVDHLLRKDGSLIHSTRIMGTFEVVDGVIIQQRDYFCPAPRG